MSSEAMQEKANAINDCSVLITKLTNLQDAMLDFERLRLEGARFLAAEDEAHQEYAADLDSIRALAGGSAGDALAAELKNPLPLDHLRHLGENDLGEIERSDVQLLAEALDRALTRAHGQLRALLQG